VIAVFQARKQRGRITLTDARMTRFCLTLEQGVQFVVSCVEQMPRRRNFRAQDSQHAAGRSGGDDCARVRDRDHWIRPGEKLHEVPVSEDEARNTLEVEDRYIIQPSHPWWRRENWVNARPLPEGFRYASDNNDRWLTNRELQE
jgi:FlaA1/EpsC-like NDP-sugar epimerase